MYLRYVLVLTWMLAAPFSACGDDSAFHPRLPENHAPKAKITTDFQHSDAYRAELVADGKIPQNLVRSDYGQVWITETDHEGGARLTFVWDQPTAVHEILYYGPTAHNLRRCWKNFEIVLDDRPAPILTGQFEMRHGEQRIVLPRRETCRKLTFHFADHYGGRNPGAAEVRIYPRKLTHDELAFLREGRYYQMTRNPAARKLEEDFRNGRLGFDQFIVIQRHKIHPSHVYTYHQEGHRPGGGLFLATLSKDGAELKQLVDSSEGEILDCNLSYDAKSLLFSWRRTMADKVQIYCINIDGTDLRQITDHESNNVNPCWLADDGIGFLSDRKPAFAYCWTTTTPILYRCDRDGNNVRRLSANYLNDFTPSVMEDGRIIFSRWEYVDRPAIPIQSLWTMYPDGTGLSGVFGNRVLSPATFMEPRQVPGTRKVLCVLTAHNGDCSGAVGLIDPTLGANAQEAIENLTPECWVGLVGEGNGNDIRGPYENPFPIEHDLFFVSRAGTILLRDYEGTRQIEVLRGEGEDGLGYYSAQPIRPRPLPELRPSIVLKTDKPSATLMLEDVYNGLTPHVQRGEITRIAVVQEVEKSRFASLDQAAFGFQFPVVSCAATYAPKKVWGFADVEPDGSAHFRVPTGVPIYFMALDEHGRALQRMRSFTHLMPGERQSCIGCHADRNSTTPRLNTRPMAGLRAARELDVPEWGAVGFSYPHLVQPVLDRYCVKCHDAREKAGGIDLGADRTDFFNVSYEVLAREGYPGRNPFTKWICTYNGMESNILEVEPKFWGSPASKLADLVLHGHPDTNGKPRVALDRASRQRIFTWIDLNVPYYGTSVANNYDIKGCRQMVPEQLDTVLQEVAERRCVTCHKDAQDRNDGFIFADGKIHRKVWTRITNPELNNFLLAPLAKSAGGTEACGSAVFKTEEDPDYQAILKTFEPVALMIRQRPRVDMMPWDESMMPSADVEPAPTP